ncbi:DMT family transporter [Clostridium luticellarii]|jgi:drug/metabolite transporter (DMT)-like permease|uniref:EamA-like transporter family protein n=1 Tax=Clostridium luticellarii TaxID=1691940 RepID=A0A2T0BM98_9CLOT|nr:DMT family transporter [Clostridium luticellarii]MCI1945197.1 DMT family transporter [Clostridium luticellarii]MCI1968841.1 DMT family transporter [Clostridium luticellarii]MCI1995627.1 DMT family transporter [Clostridium luticellarii]MCI2040015.1 DMT family transporter [Clostridium luticellarii]PRR85006.1 EamA-like transporter family protein [Clostridium luticellarii]
MRKGYLYGALSAVLFGSCGIIIKIAFEEGMDSINILIFQYIISIPIMFFAMLFIDKSMLKIDRKGLYHTAVLGIVGNTFMTVFYYGAFNYLDVSVVTILLYTYPIMVFTYSLVFEKNTLNFNKLCDVLIAFAGCFLTLGLINGVGNFPIKGCIFGILAALFYTFMNIYSEKYMIELNPLTMNFYSIIFSLLSLMVLRFPAQSFKMDLSVQLIVCVIMLAVLCEIIPVTLLYAAIKEIGSLKVSIIGNLEIPTAMLLSFLILGESISWLQVIGAAMVIYAVYNIKKVGG